jgi:integrase
LGDTRDVRGPTSAKGTTRTPTAQVVRAGCQSSGITGSTVRTWLAGLHEAGEVTPTTIAKAYRLLCRILNVAVEAGYLPRNPCTVKGAGIERTREMRHVSIPQLIALAEAVPGRYRALVIVAGFSGLRWAELVGLRRRHVDLAGARLHVVEQAAEVKGKIIIGPPKTEAGRRAVALPAVAVEALAEHLDRYALPGPDGLVFPTRLGPTSSAATSAGGSGGPPSSGSAWTACASTTCATPPPPWPLAPARPPRS